jgi:hypothetical protein
MPDGIRREFARQTDGVPMACFQNLIREENENLQARREFPVSFGTAHGP